MPNHGLKELYIDELKDLYNAENQLVKALPQLARAATSDELRQGFEEHLDQTKGHVERLEKIFEMLGESPKGKKCKGMEGLIEEGSEVMEEDYECNLLDAALIGAAQRVEHYEIAGYGTVRSFAETLGETEHVSLLDETLSEEKETEEKLTELARQINAEANEAGSDEVVKQPKNEDSIIWEIVIFQPPVLYGGFLLSPTAVRVRLPGYGVHDGIFQSVPLDGSCQNFAG
jgi:ferritin-like metal-binding protein YciE